MVIKMGISHRFQSSLLCSYLNGDVWREKDVDLKPIIKYLSLVLANQNEFMSNRFYQEKNRKIIII
jgi:hypothetical protein